MASLAAYFVSTVLAALRRLRNAYFRGPSGRRRGARARARRRRRESRVGDHALRREGHPRRRRPAHRGGHGLLLSADQGRRHRRRRKGRRSRSRRCSRRDSSATCRLEVEDDVLLVVVQERPTISKVEITGNKEFDTRYAEEGAEGDRRRRRAHLRPLRARSRRAGNEAPVPVARPVRGEGHGDGHAAGAQPGRHQHRDRRGRRVEDRADQHRRGERLQREPSCSAS